VAIKVGEIEVVGLNHIEAKVEIGTGNRENIVI